MAKLLLQELSVGCDTRSEVSEESPSSLPGFVSMKALADNCGQQSVNAGWELCVKVLSIIDGQ